MAEIQLQQVAQPNFGQVNALMQSAAANQSAGFADLVKTLQGVQTAVRGQNTEKLMNFMNQAQTSTQFNDQAFQRGLTDLRESLGGEYNRNEFQTQMQALPGQLNQRELQGMQITNGRNELSDQEHLRGMYEALAKNPNADVSQYTSKLLGANTAAFKDIDTFRNAALGREQTIQQMNLARDKYNMELQEHQDQQRYRNAYLSELGIGGGGDGNTVMPNDVRQAIFQGESGGDYNALLGFSNRAGKKFSNVRLTDMSIDEAIKFSDPNGDYGKWSRDQVGRVATPMGAYQIVGTTLRDAKRALGLKGDEKMTPEMQDRLGDYIFQTQGTRAWVGYKGPRMGGGGYKPQQAKPTGKLPTKAEVEYEQNVNKLVHAQDAEHAGIMLKNSPLMSNIGKGGDSLNSWLGSYSKNFPDLKKSEAQDIVDVLSKNPEMKGVHPLQLVSLANDLAQQASNQRGWFNSRKMGKDDLSASALGSLKVYTELVNKQRGAQAEVEKDKLRGTFLLEQAKAAEDAKTARLELFKRLGGL